jgi:methyl-accepting chemotaxis protein
MVLIGVIGILLSVVGIVVGQRLIDEVATGLEQNLTLTLDSMDTIYDSLLLTQETVTEVSEGLATMETAADNAALALDDTGPLLSEIADVTTERVPDSLETIQDSIPALLEVATTIDETLTILSDFQIDRQILGIPLQWDLGINYDPEVPFAASVDELGRSLDGLPGQLRVLRTDIEVTEENLRTISTDISAIADNINALNQNVADLNPLLDDYLATVTEFSDSLRETRVSLAEQMQTLKIALVVFLVWLGLTQIAPLYLGWELITGRR